MTTRTTFLNDIGGNVPIKWIIHLTPQTNMYVWRFTQKMKKIGSSFGAAFNSYL
jgi:hypothetical protein